MILRVFSNPLNDRTTPEMTIYFYHHNAPLHNSCRRQFMNGKAPLFVPQVRGSLDYARDDGAFLTLFSPTALLFCTLNLPYYPKHLSEGAIHALIFSPTHTTLYLFLYPLFLISFLFIYHCYNMLYLCLCPFFLPQIRGSLDYARDDGTQ